MHRILIIEDDLHINNLIKEAVEKDRHTCTQAFSGTEGLLCIKIENFDLIILDLMLPGARIECLSLGADDYLVKPFDIKELKPGSMLL